MRKTEETPRIYVGTDLHKLQFTVNAICEESGEIVLKEIFRMNDPLIGNETMQPRAGHTLTGLISVFTGKCLDKLLYCIIIQIKQTLQRCGWLF